MKVERQWSWWQDCCCRQTVLCEYFWLYPSSARLRRQVLTGRLGQLSTDETFSKATAVSKLLLSEINIYLFLRWKYLHISRMLLILDCTEGVLVRWGCLLTLYAGWNHASVCTEARGSSVELLSSPRPVSAVFTLRRRAASWSRCLLNSFGHSSPLTRNYELRCTK